MNPPVVLQVSVTEQRIETVFAHIHTTHRILCKDTTVGIESVLISRKGIADVLNVGKDTAASVLEEMVERGWLEKDRYLLSRRQTDNRWQWLYHITPSGYAESVF